MTRQRYNKVRDFVRNNGNFALVWFTGEELQLAEHLINIEQTVDILVERAKKLSWLKSITLHYTFKDIKYLSNW